MRNEDFQRLLEAVGLLEPPQLAVLADAVHLRQLTGSQVTGAQVANERADPPPLGPSSEPACSGSTG